MKEKNRLVLIIHNVRSAYNVGSLFRTADGAGVDTVILSGYTPSPAKDGVQFLTQAEKEIAKTALGAERVMKWSRESSFSRRVKKLHAEGFTLVALEQDAKSIDYREYTTNKNIALLVGNEVNGLDRRVLKQCDAIIDLPMYGSKNSLNVSVAGGIALYFLSSIL